MANFLPPVVAELKANISDFSAKMKAARGEMDKTESQGSSKFTALKVAGVASFAMIGLAAVKFAKGAIQEAAAGEKAQARWVTAIRNSGQPVDDFVAKADALTSAFATLGYTNDQVTEALTKMTQATNSPAKALQNIALAADIAKARNIDLSAASALVGKVLNGNVGILRRMGIVTKDASGSTLDATAAMKMLQDRFGGSAAAQAETYAGKIEAMGAQWSNFKETIGNTLLPILSQLAQVMQSLLGWFTRLDSGTQKLIGQIVIFGGAALGAVKAFTAIKAAVVLLGISMQTALGPWGLIISMLGTLAVAFGFLGDSGLDASGGTEELAQAMVDLGQASSDTDRVLKAFGHLLPGMKQSAEETHDMERVVRSLGLGAEATAVMLEELKNPTQTLVGAMARFGPKATGAAEAIISVTRAAKNLGPAFVNQNSSVLAAADAAEKLGEESEWTTEQLQEFATKLETSAKSSGRLASAISTAVSTIRAQFDKGFAADKALKDWYDGLKEFAKQVEGLKPASLDFKVILGEQASKALLAAESISAARVQALELQGVSADMANNQGIANALANMRKEATDPELRGAIDSLIEDLLKIPGVYDARIRVTMPGMPGISSGLKGSNPLDFIGGFLTKRALGGPVNNGMPYLVGEKGPELFIPNSSGTISPNGSTASKKQDMKIEQHFHGVTADSDLARRAARELGWAMRAA